MEETRERGPVLVGTKLVTSHNNLSPPLRRLTHCSHLTHKFSTHCASSVAILLLLCRYHCDRIQLHTTGFKYTTNTKVKKVKSKRDLHEGVQQDQPHRKPAASDSTSSASSTPTLHSKQLPPLHHTASISSPSVTSTAPARTVSFAAAGQSPGIHRGSIVPLDSTTAITSTDLQAMDDVREKSEKSAKRKLKRTNSARKAALKGGRGSRSGKEEKETEWIYEEKGRPHFAHAPQHMHTTDILLLHDAHLLDVQRACVDAYAAAVTDADVGVMLLLMLQRAQARHMLCH